MINKSNNKEQVYQQKSCQSPWLLRPIVGLQGERNSHKNGMTSVFLTFVLLFPLVVPPCCGLEKILPGHTVQNSYHSPLPYTYISKIELPNVFFWGNVNGSSYLTKSFNQHIPVYCGSCFAHSAVSVLSDRIKIARRDALVGDDIILSIQFLLNCGTEVAGSCHGGSATGAFEFIKTIGFIPYETCQAYVACSSDSDNDFCKYIDTSCSPENICRTCTNPEKGGNCTAIHRFPNATVAEYGTYHNDLHAIMAEIYVRGPVKASVNGIAIQNYTGGIIYDDPKLRNMTHNHGVAIVGWGLEESTNTSYWIVRNSWGQYWGELGFFRVQLGKDLLGIENNVAWATPGVFSTSNYPCWEDGGNCGVHEHVFRDPSLDIFAVKSRLLRERNHPLFHKN